jgi:hypothetical protein
MNDDGVERKKDIKHFRDLEVYQLAFSVTTTDHRPKNGPKYRI